jgi:pyruvate dehydrogenase E2 component (dihydrolipoamide acetyltransferase)
MPEQVLMPRLSDTMTSGTVSKWLKHPGDEVKKGEPIVEIETDKANIELEAYASGKLARIVLDEGQSAPVGDLIGEIALPGESPSPAAAGEGTRSASSAEASARKPTPEAPGTAVAETDAKRPEVTQQQAEAAPFPPVEAGARTGGNGPAVEDRSAPADASTEESQRRASPMARRLARELGVRLAQVKGSGPQGRIQKEDVEAASRMGGQVPLPSGKAAETALAAADVDIVPLSRMQQTIARRMVEAKNSTPHFYVSMDVDMGKAMAGLDELNEGVAHDELVTINDLILRACALALRDYPDVNSFYQDGKLIRNKRINVGFAVAVQRGLIEPVIRDTDQKGLKQLAAESKALARKMREGKAEPGDYEGGTFSISNLGMYGVTGFSAIINPPHSAILAVGTAEDRAVVMNGQLAVGKRCTLTLSADHRVFYGTTAAEFLRAVKHKLEKPLQLFI